MLKHFSSQTRSAKRQRRARQAALQGAADSVRRAIQSAKSAMPESARKAGPWAVSAAVNLALFATDSPGNNVLTHKYKPSILEV